MQTFVIGSVWTDFTDSNDIFCIVSKLFQNKLEVFQRGCFDLFHEMATRNTRTRYCKRSQAMVTTYIYQCYYF